MAHNQYWKPSIFHFWFVLTRSLVRIRRTGNSYFWFKIILPPHTPPKKTHHNTTSIHSLRLSKSLALPFTGVLFLSLCLARSFPAIQTTVNLLRAGSPPPHKEARQKRKELRQKLLAEQEELERQMKELQMANENKQKELETVRKVGVGAADLRALSSISVVVLGLKYN